MTPQEYIQTEIAKADQAITKEPNEAITRGHFARIRKLKFALEIILEMQAKKIWPGAS